MSADNKETTFCLYASKRTKLQRKQASNSSQLCTKLFKHSQTYNKSNIHPQLLLKYMSHLSSEVNTPNANESAHLPSNKDNIHTYIQILTHIFKQTSPECVYYPHLYHIFQTHFLIHQPVWYKALLCV